MCEIGDMIAKKLVEDGIDTESVLAISVPADKFGKVEEDLFYRTKKDGESFVPSDGKIEVKVNDNVRIMILRENGTDGNKKHN